MGTAGLNDGAPQHEQRAASAARVYDYMLGGIHNFPADRAAAQRLIEVFPFAPTAARANRAFLRRAIAYLAGAGIRQFLDLGSGIPTQGNVHEIAERHCAQSRVVYVDFDSVAVAESLDLLDGNDRATVIRADLRDPASVLGHPEVVRLLDLDQPVAVLLASVLHFVAEDEQAYGLVRQYLDAVPVQSHLVVSHGASEAFAHDVQAMRTAADAYKRSTAVLGVSRDRAQVTRFFDGLNLVEPGVTWVHEWRPDPQEHPAVVDDRFGSGEWCAVGVKSRA